MASAGKFFGQFIATSKIIAGVTAAAAGTLLSGDRSLDAFWENLLNLGAPTLVGCTVATMVVPPIFGKMDGNIKKVGGAGEDLIEGLVAGGATVGLLMLAGALPRQLDSQVLMTAILSGGSCLVGDYVSQTLGDK